MSHKNVKHPFQKDSGSYRCNCGKVRNTLVSLKRHQAEAHNVR